MDCSPVFLRVFATRFRITAADGEVRPWWSCGGDAPLKTAEQVRKARCEPQLGQELRGYSCCGCRMSASGGKADIDQPPSTAAPITAWRETERERPARAQASTERCAPLASCDKAGCPMLNSLGGTKRDQPTAPVTLPQLVFKAGNREQEAREDQRHRETVRTI